MRERGSWEKNLERETEAEYVFVSLDLDEKPKKVRRSRRSQRERGEAAPDENRLQTIWAAGYKIERRREFGVTWHGFLTENHMVNLGLK